MGSFKNQLSGFQSATERGRNSVTASEDPLALPADKSLHGPDPQEPVKKSARLTPDVSMDNTMVDQ